MAFFVYVLKSMTDGNLYIGHTQDIETRLIEHNRGRVRSTHTRKPFELIYTEEFNTRSQARWRERHLKTAWEKKKLKRSLNVIPL